MHQPHLYVSVAAVAEERLRQNPFIMSFDFFTNLLPFKGQNGKDFVDQTSRSLFLKQ